MNTRILLSLLLVGCGEETTAADDPDALGRLVQALGLGVLDIAPNGTGGRSEGANGLGAPSQPGGLGASAPTPDGLSGAPGGGGATCRQACARGLECFGDNVDLADCTEECEDDIQDAGLAGQILLNCIVQAPSCNDLAACIEDEDDENAPSRASGSPDGPGRSPTPT